ncbi:MAG: hypothetical protein IAF94_17150 [Pirellulaceae bacterium]|nr:hypothetical protein [Pirellulaceae bacterium]
MTTPVKSIVSFVASFPQEYTDDGAPPGEELANFIASSVRQSGLASGVPDERGGWAWEFVTKDDGAEVFSIVGLVDDMDLKPPRQWLITISVNSGFFSRLFGGSGAAAKREKLLRIVCEAIHKRIQSDDRFSEVRWYSDKTFDQPDDQPGLMP